MPLTIIFAKRLQLVYLTRKEHFNAAHQVINGNWSEEKNKEVFGKWANKNWHGHNYDLYVTVKGQPNPETGFIMNVKELSVIIKEQVLNKLDHKNLNLDVPELKDKFPTTENLSIEIWKMLEPYIKECKLHCIKLWETDNIYTEYFGE